MIIIPFVPLTLFVVSIGKSFFRAEKHSGRGRRSEKAKSKSSKSKSKRSHHSSNKEHELSDDADLLAEPTEVSDRWIDGSFIVPYIPKIKRIDSKTKSISIELKMSKNKLFISTQVLLLQSLLELLLLPLKPL